MSDCKLKFGESVQKGLKTYKRRIVLLFKETDIGGCKKKLPDTGQSLLSFGLTTLFSLELARRPTALVLAAHSLTLIL